MYKTRTAQGAPCWVSLLAHDLETVEKFYGGLFGWTFRPASQRLGPYVHALKDGAAVAGLGAAAANLGVPSSWTPYFHAESADEVVERVRERGATVAVGPVAFGGGRVAWAADPVGAMFGIWEGEVDPGWQAGAGSPALIELWVPDAFAAAIFYGEVFHWDQSAPDRIEVRYEYERVLLRIDGRTAAGVYGTGADRGAPRTRPRWHVYFRVESADTVAQQAVSLGGAGVAAPPRDTPLGRVAALRDPEGVPFSVAEYPL